MSAYLKTLVLSDSVIMDSFTGKWSIIGVSNALVVPAIPCRAPYFSAFAQVANVGGPVVGRFQVLDPELMLVYEEKTPEVNTARSGDTEFLVRFRNLVLNQQGRHTVQFMINDEVVGTTALYVDMPAVPEAFGG